MKFFIALQFMAFSLLISSCGFSPVYINKPLQNQQNKTAPIKSSFNDIRIALIPDRKGQFLRNALIDRFYTNGMPNTALYMLKIPHITESIDDFDITIDSEATRRQLKLTITMSLVDAQTNKLVLHRQLLSVASYNVLQSEFSTIVTEQSARENALNDLARQIEQQVALYIGSN